MMAKNKETTDQAKSSKDPKKSRRSTSSNKSKKSANILPKDDPNFMREKNRYESPIASREYIINLIDKSSGNLNFEQIYSVGWFRRRLLRRRLLLRRRFAGWHAKGPLNLG